MLSVLTFSFYSCSKDDDENGLVGTVWFGTGNDSEEIVIFNSETELKWSGGELGTGIIMTYTFNAPNGNMKSNDDNFDFTINGKSLIIYNGDESTYIKQ